MFSYIWLLYKICIAFNVLTVLQGDLFSVISVTGNGDMFQHVDYTRKGEMEDERVDLLQDRIRQKFDWSST